MKSMKSIFAFMGALAFACSFTCCSDDDDSEEPAPEVYDDLSGDIKTVKQTITVTMESNSSTGYQWIWMNKKDAAADSVSYYYKPLAFANDSMVRDGSGGTDVWTFKPKTEGADSLVFYVRPAWARSNG